MCVSPSPVASLEQLAYRRNVASLSLFYGYYFVRCTSELDELVPLPPSRGRSTFYFNRLHDFSVTIPGCYKDAYVNSFFPRMPRFWNSLPAECFSLTYNLNSLSLELTGTFFPWVLCKQLSSMILFLSSFTCNSILRSGCSSFPSCETQWKRWSVIKRSKLWKC